MKENQKKETNPVLALPKEVSTACGFDESDTLAFHAGTAALILMREKMTAIQVANCIETLEKISLKLSIALAKSAGICNGCGSLDGKTPAECVASCTLCEGLFDEKKSIQVPDYLLEEAAIPKNAKLEAYADEGSGEIIVIEAENQYDITDVPEGIISVMAASGVCLVELEEHILKEDIIYGS